MTEPDVTTSTYRVDPFYVLSHQRRVLVVLALLLASSETVSIGFLAEVIAVFTTGKRPRKLSTADYNRSRQSLLKSHLAALADAGVVTLDGTAVSQGPEFQRYGALALLRYLDLRAGLVH